MRFLVFVLFVLFGITAFAEQMPLELITRPNGLPQHPLFDHRLQGNGASDWDQYGVQCRKYDDTIQMWKDAYDREQAKKHKKHKKKKRGI